MYQTNDPTRTRPEGQQKQGADGQHAGPTANGQHVEAVTDGIDFDPAKLEAEAPPPLVPLSVAASGQDLFDPAYLGLPQDFAAVANVASDWKIIKKEKPSKSR